MPNYDELRQVDDVEGVTVTEWPNRPAASRFTVLHPKCGANIRPTSTEDAARSKANTHARKCNG
jgi:hypothetical protein